MRAGRGNKRKGREKLALVLAACHRGALGGYISEPPDVFVMSTQRPSVVARGQERKGLHSTFCLCGVIVLQFKSGKE